MMRFFYYCFYRISCAYKKWDKDFNIYANGIITMCLSFNILSTIALFCIIRGCEYSIEVLGTIVIVNYVFGSFFVFTKKRYWKLHEYWKNENPKYKTLKGWGVFLYIIFSLTAFFVTLGIMSNPGSA